MSTNASNLGYAVYSGSVRLKLKVGVGSAFSEQFEYIEKHSLLAGAGFSYIKQVPDDMEIIYVEMSRPGGSFDAAGCGELPLTSPHAAIINAIFNACGACAGGCCRVRHNCRTPAAAAQEIVRQKVDCVIGGPVQALGTAASSAL